ncbi:MAG: ABC transporter substrate-binding protein [Gammaproteobacteria bacterium]|jgi:ABC-type nitrate/sulfonate/bicarbonate transport system substrate-binding protein|nr:ABC transporter substrate-binding protein [Gammaproteobacteria bacterium]
MRLLRKSDFGHCLCVTALVLAALLLGGCEGADKQAPANTVVSPTESDKVRVFLQDPNNLQFLNFWVARGAGFFAAEDLELELVFPPNAGKGDQFLFKGKADIAVLPRPTYLKLIDQGQPVLVFANLLQNDPINLVLRENLAEQRGLSVDMPLKARLEGLKGLRVGVAPGPPPRLRELFASVGMDADTDIQIVLVRGPDQNEAFEQDKVDALYAHTPYVEKALVAQGAVLLVNQSAGEVPTLAHREIHAMVTTQAYAREHPDILLRLTRAIYKAQQLIHTDQGAAREAILASGIEMEFPAGLETIVALYAPAVPDTPAVSIAGAQRELELFPAKHKAPELSDARLAPHVDNQFVEAVLAGEH